ncbi:MAG: VanZ family protein [Candidatus Zixiibacteriota bacterium]
MRKFVLYTLPLLLYAVLIYWVSSLEKLPDPHIEFDLIDKVAHAIEYCVFSVLAHRFFAAFEPKSAKTVYIGAILLGLFYAASDEIHQLFVPGRFCDFYDWVADAIGIGCGAILYFLLSSRSER